MTPRLRIKADSFGHYVDPMLGMLANHGDVVVSDKPAALPGWCYVESVAADLPAVAVRLSELVVVTSCCPPCGDGEHATVEDDRCTCCGVAVTSC